MRAKKVDKNQDEIVKELRRCGITVFVASDFGRGFPDLATPFRGRNWFIEIKTETGKLTKDQERFIEGWKDGQYSVCRTTEQVLEAIGAKQAIEELADAARRQV